jgi:hypothetical protein
LCLPGGSSKAGDVLYGNANETWLLREDDFGSFPSAGGNIQFSNACRGIASTSYRMGHINDGDLATGFRV